MNTMMTKEIQVHVYHTLAVINARHVPANSQIPERILLVGGGVEVSSMFS